MDEAEKRGMSIDEIIKLRSAIVGFEASPRYPKPWTRTLAELDADGTFLFWDTKSPYSDDAVDFIAAAPAAVDALLAEVARLTAERDAAIGALRGLVDAPLDSSVTSDEAARTLAAIERIGGGATKRTTTKT